MKVLDTISATTTGGRDGTGHTSDNKLEVKFARSKGLGGKGDGLTPEHLFAQGYSACFCSAVQLVAGMKKVAIGTDFSIEAKVDLTRQDDNTLQLQVELTAKAPSVDKAVLEDLVNTAHTICPYSRAVHGNVPVKLIIA